MYLKDRTGRKGTCWPAIGTIARDLGLSRSTVKRALKDLEEKGYLKREIRHRENGGGLLQTAIPFCKEKGHTWGKVCPDSGPGIGAGWTDRKETGEESNRGRREKCHEMQ